MATAAQRWGGPRFDWLCACLVGACGFWLYAATAFPFPDWLDSPELMTASYGLGVFHPPGAPLAVLLGHLLTFWPFGPAGVALLMFSAVFGALALVLLTRTCQALWDLLGPAAPVTRQLCCALAPLAFAGSAGLWSQAVRPEVYTLGLCLFLGTLREVVLLLCAPAERAPRHLYRAAACLGLGLAVHPLQALSALPAIGIGLAAGLRRGVLSAPGTTLRALLACAIGAAPLLLSPLLVRGPMDLRWGDPRSLAGFLELTLGTTFSHSFTGPAPLGGSGVGKLALVLFEGLGPALAILAAIGMVLLARAHLRLALALVLTLIANALTLLFQRSFRLDNPDVTGYALPALGTLFLFGAAGLWVILRVVLARWPRGRWLAAVAVLALGATTVAPNLAVRDRSGCTAARPLAEQDLLRLPRDTVAILGDFNLAFTWRYLQEVEALRPDVTILHLRDLDNPPLRAWLAEQRGPWVRLLPRADRLTRADLGPLLRARPVALDLGPHLQFGALLPMQPLGLVWLLSPDAAPVDETGWPRRQQDALGPLAPPRCTTGDPIDRRAAEILLWHAYWQAAGAYAAGRVELSRVLLSLARCTQPEDRQARQAEAQWALLRPLIRCDTLR